MSDTLNHHDALISELSDDPDMLELVELFVSEFPARIQAMEQAIAAEDVSALATLAHQLKGAAGGYGFPSITDAALHIETGAKANSDVEALKSGIDALADLCRRARAK